MLAVVSAVGGPERIVSRDTTHTSPKGWSADGKWIFVQVNNGGGARSVARIPAQGGPAETVFSYSGQVASIGSDVAFAMDKRPPAEGPARVSYVTRSGQRGEFSVPPGSVRARYVSVESGAKWLVVAHAKTSGTHTSTVYELDVSPILQALPKR